MPDKLITDLQELSGITEDTYVPVRNATAGTRKYNLKSLIDTVDAAAQAADDAAAGASDAATRASASATQADQAATNASNAAQSANAAREAIQDELAAKADERGAADRLLAGASRTVLGEEVEGAFLERVCPASADGVAEISEIRGNTVVWNQLVTDGGFLDPSKWKRQSSGTSLAVENGIATVTVVDNTIADRPNVIPSSNLPAAVAGHTYLARAKFKKNSTTNPLVRILYGDFLNTTRVTQNDTWVSISFIKKVSTPTYTSGDLYITEAASSFENGDSFSWGGYNIFDLTAMYGAGNEPTTVEEFEAQWGSDYKPYSAPRLLDTHVLGLRSVGSNLLDLKRTDVVTSGTYSRATQRNLTENQIWVGISVDNYFNNQNITSWEAIDEGFIVSAQSGYGVGFPVKVSPSTLYRAEHFGGDGKLAIGYYDEDGNYISYNTNYDSKIDFTTPANCRWVMLVLRPSAGSGAVTYLKPIMHLSNSLNGAYKPYMSDELALPERTLRGIGTARDVMTRNGVQRNVGVLELAVDDMNNQEDYPGWNTNAVRTAFGAGVNALKNATFEKGANRIVGVNTVGTSNGILYLSKAIYGLTQTEWKQQYAGTVFHFTVPLATPTFEQFETPIDITYTVQEGGTEAWAIPEGDAPTSAPPTALTAYPTDAADLRDLPLSAIAPIENGVASANYAVGDYLVRNGNLYKVTTAIAAGETITPGTNCTATTVMAEIVRLTA